VDPLAPENVFIVAAGPTTGTRIWSRSRFAVLSKSPATGGYGESYCGGSLAPKIKACGVDALLISGRCGCLSFLEVSEEGARYHEAEKLTGRETFEAEEALPERSKAGAGAMVIGPAGENLARLACIKSDRWRSLGRGGMGAVLRAKNLKGIAFAGSREAQIHDEPALREIVREIAREARDAPAAEVYQKYGTPNQVRVTNAACCFPTRYWSSGYSEHWERLSAAYMHDHFEVKRHGCLTRFLQCTKQSRVKSGRPEGLVLDGPEFETIYAFGGLNCIDSLEEVAYLNDLCDRLGLDTMSAGNLSAFTIEAHKREKVDFPLDYNQPDRVADLLRLVAAREGIGELLGEGTARAAAALGLEEMVVHVKGLEPAVFDPPVLKGMGLSYATVARGDGHLRGTFYRAELSGEIEHDRVDNKAVLFADYEDRAALFDCLFLCRFYRDFVGWDRLAGVLRGPTRIDLSRPELELIANRITQATREYNRREGFGPEHDTLLPTLLETRNDEGAALARRELATMIDQYNRIWNVRDAETETRR
jgi:aldehyde:ferredoxin oxidoreductase